MLSNEERFASKLDGAKIQRDLTPSDPQAAVFAIPSSRAAHDYSRHVPALG